VKVVFVYPQGECPGISTLLSRVPHYCGPAIDIQFLSVCFGHTYHKPEENIWIWTGLVYFLNITPKTGVFIFLA
jgi:hypothetical protein